MTTTRKSIPAGVKQPEDRKPKQADEFTVSWEGHEYVIEMEAMEDIFLHDYLRQGMFAAGMPILLGDEQWAEFRNNHHSKERRLTATRMGDFFDHVKTARPAAGN
jgi:hypothetical protein